MKTQPVEDVLGEAAPSGGSSGSLSLGGHSCFYESGEVSLWFKPIEHHPLLGRRAYMCARGGYWHAGFVFASENFHIPMAKMLIAQSQL